MNQARHHTFNQTAHIFDSTSHTSMYRPGSPLSSSRTPSGLRSPPPASQRIPIPSSSSSTKPAGSPRSSRESRKPSTNLHLPGLPRYHPANFVNPAQIGAAPHTSSPFSPSGPRSADASVAGTPLAPLDSPQTPSTPRQQSQRYTEAQRMWMYQRDILQQVQMQKMGFGMFGEKVVLPESPDRPILEPLLSPGDVVTPLELEGEGYLDARRVEGGDAR